MPDGHKRKRRSSSAARMKWYAYHRSLRFNRRFGLAQ